VARLALLLPNLGSGGAERVSLTLAANFLAAGHEVDLVLVRATGALLGEAPPGARLTDLGATRLRGAIWPLRKYLLDRRPEALLVSMWPLTVVAIIAAKLSGAPTRVLVSDHSILSRQYDGRLAPLRWTTRLFYPLAAARICVSQGAAADLSNISDIPIERFTVIHNPVQPPALSESDPAIDALWNGAERRILTVGVLKPAKNHELLIRALARLRQTISAKLVIVGEGECRPRLEQLVRDLGLEEHVILPGYISNPWPYYASAQLFVLSSNREGFGNALVEAMLAGLPVVSTDCDSGPREILDDGKFGQLVPVGDADALVAAMAAALDRRHDAEAGRERAIRLTKDSAARYLELMLGSAR
jgi:glycosyltransferase involved in cell wall biosynthesis